MKDKKELPEKKSAEKPKLVKVTQTGDHDISVHMLQDSFQQTGCRTQEGAEAVIVSCVDLFRNMETSLAVKEANDHLALMAELKPQDAFEGLLISQMLMVHKQAMYHLNISNLDGNRGSTAIQDSLTNRYTKLMRLYAQQMEALDKHRRGGNQKMTVEHVHVHEGGQAIVGNVSQGGGGKHEK
jgi:hypothetical protein